MAKKEAPRKPDKRTDEQVAIHAIRAVTGCNAREAKERLATVDVAKLVELERQGNQRPAIICMLY